MAKLVAVTGATGFIGQALVERLLAEGWRVRLLARRLPRFLSGPVGPVEIVSGDLADPIALERLVAGVDAVAHLAGLIKARTPEEFMATNRDGVAGVLGALKAQADPAALPRFVLLSSLAAREPQLSPYAASKRAGEEVLRSQAGDIPWVAIRAPVVYGPGDRETLRFFKVVQRGWAPMAGDGQGRISAIYVDDLIGALISVLKGENPPADVYEVDDGQSDGYVMCDLARYAAREFGVRVRTVNVPKAVMIGVAALQQNWDRLWGRATMLSVSKTNEIYHPDWLRHDSRLENLIGWNASVKLDLGITKAIEWYRQKAWL
jgi:nucleoside-diphosphate-sugar epimerase